MAITMYALLRDGVPWRCYELRRDAESEWLRVKPGSKHAWEVRPVTVEF